jgi:hypothetical protein
MIVLREVPVATCAVFALARKAAMIYSVRKMPVMVPIDR